MEKLDLKIEALRVHLPSIVMLAAVFVPVSAGEGPALNLLSKPTKKEQNM